MKKKLYKLLYPIKWLLKRLGFLKSILFQFFDTLIYHPQSQFLLHPWNAHRTPFQMILYYNRFGRILFATKEFIALFSRGKIFKKSIRLEGYEQTLIEPIKKDYTSLYPPTPMGTTTPMSQGKKFIKKIETSLSLAYQMENKTFNKTVEWERVTTVFKSLFFQDDGKINLEELSNFRATPQHCQDVFGDEFFYVDNNKSYSESYLRAIDLILDYHRFAKVINKELLASVTETSTGGASFVHYRGQRLSEKLLFHTLVTNDINSHITFNQEQRNVIIDIGSGYGGLDRLLSYYIPNSCFILIDLPETLLLTSYYIKDNFPNKKIALLSDIIDQLENFEALTNTYDFIILPPSIFEKIPNESIDLIINTASMGFMEEEYIEYYLNHIYRTLKNLGHFYSLNKEYNNELGKGFYSWDFKGSYLTKLMAFNSRFAYLQWLGQKIQ